MQPLSKIQILHDRHTRGEPLSDKERAQLTAWYAQQDQEEGLLLERVAVSGSAALEQQIDTTLSQLRVVVQQIEEQTHHNEVLRRDIAKLHQQLAQRLASHAS